MRLISKTISVTPFTVFFGRSRALPYCMTSLSTSYLGKFRAQMKTLHFSCVHLNGLTDNNFADSKTIMIAED